MAPGRPGDGAGTARCSAGGRRAARCGGGRRQRRGARDGGGASPGRGGGARRRWTPRSSRASAPGSCRATRRPGRRAGQQRGAARPDQQGQAHPGDAGALRHRGEGGPHPGGPGGDPVRPRRGAGHQAVTDRGPGRQSRAGPGGALDPDRSADPGRAVRRHRDPEHRLRPRHPQGSARLAELRGGRPEQARLRAGPGRGRPAIQRRPVEDAARADRRRHRIGQERLRQRHHLLAAHARHTDRGEADPDRPQAGRDGPVQGHPAPADRGDRRLGQGGQRAEVDGRHDGGPLPRVRAARRAQHRRLQRGAAQRANRGCRTS